MLERGDWVETMRQAADHREFVGPAEEYDLSGALQFALLVLLGLRESHRLLDIGCGSLRGGRFAIAYLRTGHYCAIEPERWLVEAAIEKEIGADLIRLKSPSFDHGRDFGCRRFGRQFDFVLAQGVFTHAPLHDIAACISAAAACMAPGSTFVATFMEGVTDYEGREWLYPQVTRYTAVRLASIAAAAGLVVVPIEWPHPRGARWIGLCRPESERNLRDRAAELPASRLLAEPARRDARRGGALVRLAASVRRRLSG